MLDPCTGRPAILAVGGRRQRYSFTRATALGRASRQHLESWSGILQADAYGGTARGTTPNEGLRRSSKHRAGPMLGASSTSSSISWAAARRMAQRHAPQTISPIALEAVQRIDALSDIERSINGLSPDQQLAVR
jgi:transposase